MAFNETCTVAMYFDSELKAFSNTSTGSEQYIPIRDDLLLSVTICNNLSLSATIFPYP